MYLHIGGQRREKARQDRNFQGFGRFLTGLQRRVLLPHHQAGAVPGPHPAHPLQGEAGRRELLTTQCYVKGHPGNAQDGIWKSVTDPRARESITIDFSPAPGSPTGELAAKFDIVVGRTPTA